VAIGMISLNEVRPLSLALKSKGKSIVLLDWEEIIRKEERDSAPALMVLLAS
jgi:hypothetical protein